MFFKTGIIPMSPAKFARQEARLCVAALPPSPACIPSLRQAAWFSGACDLSRLMRKVPCQSKTVTVAVWQSSRKVAGPQWRKNHRVWHDQTQVSFRCGHARVTVEPAPEEVDVLPPQERPLLLTYLRSDLSLCVL